MAGMKTYSRAEADLAAARDELQQAQAREARLQEYLSHTPRCPIYHWQGSTISTPPDCTCGLEAALAERGDNPVWEVVEAARKFNEKMLAIEEVGGLSFGSTMARVHGMEYTGPNFAEEWTALRRKLARLDGSAEGNG